MDAPILHQDDLIERHGRVIGGHHVVHIRREAGGNKRLLVSLATHNNKGRFAGLEGLAKHFPGDLLCLVDPDNTYYLEADRGRRFKETVAEFLEPYARSEVFFFGASMAGYAAIDMALTFEANAVVNNPQLNLDRTVRSCWEELRRNILKIPHRRNLEETPPPASPTVIGALMGRHPIDRENMDALFDLARRVEGLGLIFGHVSDQQHKYYYSGMTPFLKMVEAVAAHRRLMDGVRAAFPPA